MMVVKKAESMAHWKKKESDSIVTKETSDNRIVVAARRRTEPDGLDGSSREEKSL